MGLRNKCSGYVSRCSFDSLLLYKAMRADGHVTRDFQVPCTDQKLTLAAPHTSTLHPKNGHLERPRPLQCLAAPFGTERLYTGDSSNTNSCSLSHYTCSCHSSLRPLFAGCVHRSASMTASRVHGYNVLSCAEGSRNE